MTYNYDDIAIRQMPCRTRSSVSLITCTGGAYRPFLHDRHFSAAM
jgi:hypothetical protein